MWCWVGRVTGESGTQKLNLPSPVPHANTSYRNSHWPACQHHSSVYTNQGFWRKVGQRETWIGIFSSSSWNLPQWGQVKSSKTIQFPHPVTIQVTQSWRSPSLSCHYQRVIKQLSVCYRGFPSATGDPQWAKTPEQGPSAHSAPVLRQSGGDVLLGSGFCPVSAHFDLCGSNSWPKYMIQL